MKLVLRVGIPKLWTVSLKEVNRLYRIQSKVISLPIKVSLTNL